MHVIDFNTSFGKRVDPDPRFSADALVHQLDEHDVACAFTVSEQGVHYDVRAGNAETLAACRAHPSLIPVGTLDPRDSLDCEPELERCVKEGIRAIRFFPDLQRWSISSVCFSHLLQRLAGSGVCLVFPCADGPAGAELPGRVARATAELGLSIVLTDVWYYNMAEVIAVLREFPHVYAETHWLATVGAVEIMADAVGPHRLLYGSGAPARPMQKALNQVLEADLPDEDKIAILGGNAARLLGIGPDTLQRRPALDGLQPKRFEEPIVDVHSHLGYWRAPIRDEDYDPAPMIRRMGRFGVARSVVSSYESMRYDIAAGNRKLAAALEGHPELLGYVELDPHHLDLSCAEMDRYYRLPNFAGAEIELSHIPCPTGSDKVRALMAEVARRGKPVLFLPAGKDDAAAERELARQHPDLTIIHAHGFDAAWARVVADTPNICVEYCLSRASHHDLRHGVEILGAERVLFGSDQTLLSVGAAVGLYWDADLSASQRRLVLHDNARRVFHL